MGFIETIDGVSPKSVRALVCGRKQPLVIRNLTTDWPGVQANENSLKNTLRMFASETATVTLMKGKPEHQGRLFYAENMQGFNFSTQQVPLTIALESVFTASNNTSHGARYLGSVPISESFPALAEDHCLPGFEAKSATQKVWLGNSVSIAAHYDEPDNLACVVAGKRKFTLFPPEQISNLYIGPIDFNPAGQSISMVDLSNPDFKRYPKFKEALANAQHAELGKGDALYIPSLWWHAVQSLAPFNLLVNFWWNEKAERDAEPFASMIHSILAIGRLPNKEKQAWKALYDHYVFNHGDPVKHLDEAHKLGLGRRTPALLQGMKNFILSKLPSN